MPSLKRWLPPPRGVTLGRLQKIFLVNARLHNAHPLGVGGLDQPKCLLGVPVSQVELCFLGEQHRGLRSWLMVVVSVFGSVVMKENTSMSTFGPAFLIGPFHCR